MKVTVGDASIAKQSMVVEDDIKMMDDELEHRAVEDYKALDGNTIELIKTDVRGDKQIPG